MTTIDAVLRNDSGIGQNYEHSPKCVTPEDPIEGSNLFLKWYWLAPEDRQVPDQIDRLARKFLTRQTNLEAKGLGFVILHRCGEDFYFLIVNTWRGNNEVWETLFYKNGDAMNDFDLWPPDGMHKPTFCVWELAPVWHETKSWEKFLMSKRDEAAAKIWQADGYAGEA